MTWPSRQTFAIRRELATQRQWAEAMRATAADQQRQTAVSRRDNATIRTAAAAQRTAAANQRVRAAKARQTALERTSRIQTASG